MKISNTATLFAFLGLVWTAAPHQAEARRRHAHDAARHLARHSHSEGGIETAGYPQRGLASVYSGRFHGRKMADGTRFTPASNAAASKTLPLGTTAQVTNLENGRATIVQVRDRGPHRAGRIVDLSPGSAAAIGMDRNSTAPVAVAPVGQAPVDR